MRPGINSRTNYFSKNAKSLESNPAKSMRVMNSFVTGVERSNSCYIIYEEQSSDIQIDENENEQQSEVGSMRHNELFTKNLNNNDIDDNVRTDESIHVSNSSIEYDDLNDSNNDTDVDTGTNLSLISLQNLSSINTLIPNVSTPTTTPLLRPVSYPTSLNELQHYYNNENSTLPDTKSGHLVLIVPSLRNKFVPLKVDTLSNTDSRAPPPSRCPVIVKIQGTGYDKYAVVSSTRRNQCLTSFCVKLKYSRVTQSTSLPSRFTVIIDSDGGKTFHFEASNQQIAREWMKAFSINCPNYQHRSTGVKDLHTSSMQTVKETTGQQTMPEQKISPKLSSLSGVPIMPILTESADEED